MGDVRKKATPELALIIRTLQSLAKQHGAYMATITTRVDGRTDTDVVWGDTRHNLFERYDENDDGDIVLQPLRVGGEHG